MDGVLILTLKIAKEIPDPRNVLAASFLPKPAEAVAGEAAVAVLIINTAIAAFTGKRCGYKRSPLYVAPRADA